MTPGAAGPWTLTSRGPQETQALGRLLGQEAGPGTLALLTGELGAGKTCFAQGVAAGLGVQDQVASPTFILAAEYAGRLPLYHLDLYRIETPAEAEGLDLDRFLGEDGVTLVEWPERAPELWPADHLTIALRHLNEKERELTLEAAGPRSQRLLQRLCQRATARP